MLKQLVMADLQRVTQFAARHEKAVCRYAGRIPCRNRNGAFAEMQRTLDTRGARHSELDVIIQRLYEDNIKGKLSDERFAKMSTGYEAEQAGLADNIQELTAALSEKKDKTANISHFLSLVNAISFEDFDPRCAEHLHQKIVVHEVDKSSGQRVPEDVFTTTLWAKVKGHKRINQSPRVMKKRKGWLQLSCQLPNVKRCIPKAYVLIAISGQKDIMLAQSD